MGQGRYKKLIDLLENRVILAYKLKAYITEHLSLSRKKKLFKNIRWSEREKKEFNAYWKKHYGRRITPNGHKLLQCFNDTYHKDYFPTFLYASKLEPVLNDLTYVKVFNDKSLTELLYAKSGVVTPPNYLIKSNNTWYDHNREIISIHKAETILINLKEKIVIKPTVWSSGGKNIHFFNFDSSEKLKREFIADLLQPTSDNFIIQQAISQHPSLIKLHPSSVNTIRVMTYIANENVYHAKLILRIGRGNRKVDNTHSEGLVVGLTDEGELFEEAYTSIFFKAKQTCRAHPDTKVVFKNYRIPGIPAVIEMAKKLHGYTPRIGMISWDFAIDEKEQPVLIEINLLDQSIWFPQIVHATPFFEENTEYMLSLIKK